MKTAKEALIQESITLPLEIRDKIIKNMQISFQFEDGSMHHVIPINEISMKLSHDCLNIVSGRKQHRHLKNWNFLNDEDILL